MKTGGAPGSHRHNVPRELPRDFHGKGKVDVNHEERDDDDAEDVMGNGRGTPDLSAEGEWDEPEDAPLSSFGTAAAALMESLTRGEAPSVAIAPHCDAEQCMTAPTSAPLPRRKIFFTPPSQQRSNNASPLLGRCVLAASRTMRSAKAARTLTSRHCQPTAIAASSPCIWNAPPTVHAPESFVGRARQARRLPLPGGRSSRRLWPRRLWKRRRAQSWR